MDTLSTAGMALFVLGMSIILATTLVSIVFDARDLGRD